MIAAIGVSFAAGVASGLGVALTLALLVHKGARVTITLARPDDAAEVDAE